MFSCYFCVLGFCFDDRKYKASGGGGGGKGAAVECFYGYMPSMSD